MNIKFIDMFCGIRGFRLGLERATTIWEGQAIGEVNKSGGQGELGRETRTQFNCVWSNDNDRYACQISRKHYPDDNLYEGDIRTVDTDAIPEHDLLCAGFPCQSFSIAGKRRGFEDTRGTLFFEICRVIRAKRPGYLFLENVKGLLSHDDGNTFETIIGTLDELGYDCQWQVLNSKDYGVPQNRERVFIIGHLRGKPRPKVFPIGETDQVYTETDGERIVTAPITTENAHQFGKNVTWKQARDIARAIDANYGKGWLDHGQRTMIYDVYNQGLRANQELAGALKGEGIADTSLGTALIQIGQVGKKDNMGQRIYDPKGIATSIRSEGGGQGAKTGLYEVAQALQTDGQLRQGVSWGTDKPQSARNIRRLTPLECERLQGFPDSWTEGISDTQRYKCLGNAVTVNVIEAIGRQMAMELNA